MSKTDEYFCRICGYTIRGEEPFWYDGVSPSYDICPACGNQTGQNDIDLPTVKQYRKQWLETGPKWWTHTSYPPKDWDPIKQMENIPPEWQ